VSTIGSRHKEAGRAFFRKKVKKTFDAQGLWHYQPSVNANLNLRLSLNALLPSRAAVEV
jgi:hypothetical protein